jgi:hypothetical protein
MKPSFDIKWCGPLDHVIKKPTTKMIQLQQIQEIMFDRSVTQWKPIPRHQHYWNKKPPPNEY